MHATDYPDFDVDLDGTSVVTFRRQFALLTGHGVSPYFYRGL